MNESEWNDTFTAVIWDKEVNDIKKIEFTGPLAAAVQAVEWDYQFPWFNGPDTWHEPPPLPRAGNSKLLFNAHGQVIRKA